MQKTINFQLILTYWSMLKPTTAYQTVVKHTSTKVKGLQRMELKFWKITVCIILYHGKLFKLYFLLLNDIDSM